MCAKSHGLKTMLHCVNLSNYKYIRYTLRPRHPTPGYRFQIIERI